MTYEMTRFVIDAQKAVLQKPSPDMKARAGTCPGWPAPSSGRARGWLLWGGGAAAQGSRAAGRCREGCTRVCCWVLEAGQEEWRLVMLQHLAGGMQAKGCRFRWWDAYACPLGPCSPLRLPPGRTAVTLTRRHVCAALQVDECEFEEGEVYAIDIIFTTGEGKPK